MRHPFALATGLLPVVPVLPAAAQEHHQTPPPEVECLATVGGP